MKNLLHWEFKGLFKTARFKGMFLFMIFIGLIYVGIGYADGIHTGEEFFAGACDFVVSALYMAGAVFAGICITSAYQDRLIQSAVMAGNSRFAVLMSKSLVYFISLAIFILCPVLLSFLISSFIIGIGEFTRGLPVIGTLGTASLVLLVNLASLSVCIPISFFIKSIGASIGVNVAVMILWYGLTQSFVTNPGVMYLLGYTTMGQSFLIYGDLTSTDVVKAVIVSILTIFISVFITFVKFSKEELK